MAENGSSVHPSPPPIRLGQKHWVVCQYFQIENGIKPICGINHGGGELDSGSQPASWKAKIFQNASTFYQSLQPCSFPIWKPTESFEGNHWSGWGYEKIYFIMEVRVKDMPDPFFKALIEMHKTLPFRCRMWSESSILNICPQPCDRQTHYVTTLDAIAKTLFHKWPHHQKWKETFFFCLFVKWNFSS